MMPRHRHTRHFSIDSCRLADVAAPAKDHGGADWRTLAIITSNCWSGKGGMPTKGKREMKKKVEKAQPSTSDSLQIGLLRGMV
jgi:hypothetical protein